MCRILVPVTVAMLIGVSAVSARFAPCQETLPLSPAQEEGYQDRRSQTWTGHDGTPLRQHERTVSSSDPYNSTRQHTITLPDGRTVSQTHVRSWDGTQATMERSFAGPNGQTHQMQRSWTPGQQVGEHPLTTVEPARPTSIVTPAAPTTSPPAERVGWMQKLNPFRDRGKATASSAPAPRRGFSIGTPDSNTARSSSFRPGENASVRGSQHTHRPTWAGSATPSMRSPGPPPQANGMATASRPNSGRGNRR